MQVKKSYRIWFAPRSGSTLLCKTLEDTGIAGKPGEFFTLFEYSSMTEKYDVSSYDDLKRKLWGEGTSENGVFGIKLYRDDDVINELRILFSKSEGEDLSIKELMNDLFPNCKDIFLTRRNKVRQAVSWWKAIKDNVWHLESGKVNPLNGKEFYQKNYDLAALSHLFKEAILRECAMQDFFANFDILPLTIVYEDMVKDYKSTVLKIINYLEIDAVDLEVKKMYFRKTADTESEYWVQQLRADLQKGMTKKAW